MLVLKDGRKHRGARGSRAATGRSSSRPRRASVLRARGPGRLAAARLDPAGGRASGRPRGRPSRPSSSRTAGRSRSARLGRRDGLVLFETTRGEAFSVREDQVVSPPLESHSRRGRRRPRRSGPRADPGPQGRPPHPGAAPGPPRRPGPLPDDARRGLLGRGGQGGRAAARDHPFARRARRGPAADAHAAADARDAAGAASARPRRPLRPGRRCRSPSSCRCRRAGICPSPPTRAGRGGRLVDPVQPEHPEGRQAGRSGNSMFLVLRARSTRRSRRRSLPVGSGVSAAARGQPGVLRPRRASSSRARAATVSAELFKGQTAFRPKTLGAEGHGRRST